MSAVSGRSARSGRVVARSPNGALPGSSFDRMAAMNVTVIVIVQAAPVLTASLDETMCVAGARLTGDGVEWIRLHPSASPRLGHGCAFRQVPGA